MDERYTTCHQLHTTQIWICILCRTVSGIRSKCHTFVEEFHSWLENCRCPHYSRASDYGLMKIDHRGRVLYFNEKPKGEQLKAMVIHGNCRCSVLQFKLWRAIWRNWVFYRPMCRGIWKREDLTNSDLGWANFQQVDTTVLGLSPEEAWKSPYIASMGIYVFRKDVLMKLLRYVASS